MVQDTCASRLLGIEGLTVTEVEDTAEGVRLVYAVTSDDVVRRCPSCATVSAHPKCFTTATPRDLDVGGVPVRLVWHKRRWYCRTPACPAGSFTESLPQVPARARVTCRLRQAAGAAVCDGGRTVEQSGRDHGLSWPTVQQAFEQAAAQVLPEAPPATEVLGMDETRRGRARFAVDPHTGAFTQVADRWHTGFVDLTGRHGLLGQVEGRAAADVGAWLAEHDPTWRDAVKIVAIDMCASYRAAIRQHLPQATIVVDHFHLVQLANQTIAQVRRRVTATVRGRRAHADDPEDGIRRRLQRNLEDLKPGQFNDMWQRLDQLGIPGEHIKLAYIAKEELRRLLRLARTQPSRALIRRQLHVFYSWCAEDDVPELHRLACTVEAWWPQIEAFLHTGITNAGSEGTNRVIKLEARNAYGFRNPDNQRLRCQAASTRRRRRIHRLASKTG